MPLLRVIPLAVLSVLTGFLQPSQAQLTGLARRVPDTANTLVLLNPELVFKSPLAVKENWREEQENAFAAGITMLPPTARQFLMAAQMDFEFMQPIWELAMVNLAYPPSLPRLAAERNGQIDRVDGRSAVLLPTDAYVIQFGEQTIGGMRPANRQRVTRWLRQTDQGGGRPDLSPYLLQALDYSDKGGTPIIMAMDLDGVLSAELIRGRLDQVEFLKGRNIDLDQLSQALASVRGLTLGIVIKDQVLGSLKIDFEQDVSMTEDFAKDLLLYILANNQAMIDEFNDWTPRVTTKEIRISGPLYPSGLRRILSVLEPPPAAQVPEAAEATAAGRPATEQDTEQSLKRLASQQYYKSVTGFVDDLKEDKSRKNLKTLGQAGLWFEKYANKIDNLPILNVDSELLDYGGFVSTSLRDAGSSLRNVGGRSRVRQLNAPAQYNTYGRARWGGNGWYGGAYGGYVAVEDPRAEAQNRARIQTEERVGGAASARDIMQQVANATADIRRKMTEKYQAEF